MVFKPKPKTDTPAGEAFTTIITNLINIANNYDAWWTSPKGRACQITASGLWIPELQSAFPWGNIKYSDLLNLARDNYSHINKAPLITRKGAGFPVKKTKYVPRHMGRVIQETKPMPQEPEVKWEEIPPGLPEPEDPLASEEVPF